MCVITPFGMVSRDAYKNEIDALFQRIVTYGCVMAYHLFSSSENNLRIDIVAMS